MIEISDSLADDATLTVEPDNDTPDHLVLNVWACQPGDDRYVAAAGIYLDKAAAESLAHYLLNYALGD